MKEANITEYGDRDYGSWSKSYLYFCICYILQFTLVISDSNKVSITWHKNKIYFTKWSVSLTMSIEGRTIAATGVSSNPPPWSITSLRPSICNFAWWPLTIIVGVLVSSYWKNNAQQSSLVGESVCMMFFESIGHDIMNSVNYVAQTLQKCCCTSIELHAPSGTFEEFKQHKISDHIENFVNEALKRSDLRDFPYVLPSTKGSNFRNPCVLCFQGFNLLFNRCVFLQASMNSD